MDPIAKILAWRKANQPKMRPTCTGVVFVPLAVMLAMNGCATGPQRAGFLAPSRPPVCSYEPWECAPDADDIVTCAGYRALPDGCVSPIEAAVSENEPKASPLSVGPMLTVVVPLNGGEVRPAQLLGGTVRLNATGRAVNAMVFGGFASKSFGTPAEGGLTGGLGASVELTPGNLLYSVDLGGGVVFGDFGPAACMGLTIQTKM
jgi:hypothetical protein